jgi:hypothetical protein
MKTSRARGSARTSGVRWGFLLGLVLLVPALAQQPDQAAQAPAKPDDKSAQAPAKPDEKAASPAPATEQWLTGSVEFGYRWLTDIRGNFPEYRSVVNLGEGPKLNGLDFTLLDPKKRLFDRVHASAYGWGGDPYSTARLNARKEGDYELSFDYRNIAYFDAVPTYANPLAPQGFDEQSFDTHRRTMSIGLDLRPGKRIIPYLVFERNSGYGHGVDTWVQNSNDSFAVPTLLRDSTNNYRGGVRFEYNHFHVTLEQGGTTYKDDDSSSFSGTNFGDRTAQVGNQTELLNSLNQAYTIRGTSIYSKGLLTAHPFSWLDIYGQFLYSEPKTTVAFTEGATGNFATPQVQFYANQQSFGIGAANQPHTTGSAGFELRPLKRLRIVESWITDRYHDAASLLFVQVGGAAPTVPANPFQVVNYNQQQTDILYDLTSRLTLRGGYRYVWGNATVLAPPLSQSGATEQGRLKRNIALAGANFRLSQKLSFNLDYEGSSSDNVYFRTSLNNYQKGRARGKYQFNPALALQANFEVLDNQNPATDIQYSFRSRHNSLAIYWTPAGGKRISVVADYDRSAVHSRIDYRGLFLSHAVSDYRDNAHTATGMINLAVPGPVAAKVTLGGSLFLSNGSRNSNYYQPLARLSFPIGKRIFWNTEWQYYDFREDFYLFEGFRTHLFMTGLKLVR